MENRPENKLVLWIVVGAIVGVALMLLVNNFVSSFKYSWLIIPLAVAIGAYIGYSQDNRAS